MVAAKGSEEVYVMSAGSSTPYTLKYLAESGGRIRHHKVRRIHFNPIPHLGIVKIIDGLQPPKPRKINNVISLVNFILPTQKLLVV